MIPRAAPSAASDAASSTEALFYDHRSLFSTLENGSLASSDGGETIPRRQAIRETAYTNAQDIPIQGEFKVLYRDKDIVVVDKPAFLPTENTATIKDSVRQRVEQMLVPAAVQH